MFDQSGPVCSLLHLFTIYCKTKVEYCADCQRSTHMSSGIIKKMDKKLKKTLFFNSILISTVHYMT